MHVCPRDLETMTFDWGSMKWFVTPTRQPEARSSLGEVILNPGRGHERHNHPGVEEIIYVISGEGEQMVDDGEPFAITAGDAVHIPAGVFHSTFNTTWRTLRLIVTYSPGGEEQALTGLPDFRLLPAGTVPQWRQDTG